MIVGFGMFDEKTIALIKIRANLLRSARCWLDQHGYVEVSSPTIVPAVGNWPGYFEVKYYDKKAFLTRGMQPYASFFVAGLEKVYSISPVFRAETSITRRHLTEFWRIEVIQQCGLDAIMAVQEQLLAHVCRMLSEEDVKTLGLFSRRRHDFAEVKAPFPRFSYDEVVEMLQKDGFNISWGQRIDWRFENYLSLKFNQPFFIMKFPVGIETFFVKSDHEKSELTLSAELFAPEGYGELSSCVENITDTEVMLEKMKEEKIDPADQLWYMSFMPKQTAAAQSGFGIGVERLLQWICKLEDIRDATAFPRVFNSFYP